MSKLLRGLAAIIFGVLTLWMPGISLAVLVLLFGAYALADGLLAVWMAFASRSKNEQWWVMLIWGLAGIGVGIVTFLAPGVTALALLFYIAIWAIVTGVLQIVAAIRSGDPDTAANAIRCDLDQLIAAISAADPSA